MLTPAHHGRRTLRSWLSGPWLTAATASTLLEQAIVLVFVVLRVGLLLQAVVAICWMAQAPSSWQAIAVTVGAAAFSVAVVVAVLRAGRISPWPWGVLDLVFAAVLVVVSGQQSFGHGNEAYNWALTYGARAVPFVVAWHRSIWLPLVAGLGFGALSFGVDAAANGEPTLSALANAVDVPVYVVTAALVVLFGGRVAAVADRNQLRAVELGAEIELARYQHHVHNATGLLAQLARHDTPSELLASLRAQAGEESNRLRREILSPSPSRQADDDDDGRVALSGVLWDACAGFSGLPLEIRTGLGRAVRLTQDRSLAVRAAVVALLYNVQFHARAENVTVHADGDDTGWEITVADDGAGFDPSTTRFGFGLATQVLASLNSQGIAVDIDSQPGEGTCITIRADRGWPSSTTVPRPGTPSPSRIPASTWRARTQPSRRCSTTGRRRRWWYLT